MQRTIALVIAAAIVCFAARAAADACDEIKKADVAACKKAAQAKCGAIEKYWDKQACIGEVAAQHDGCVKGEAYRKACEPRVADYWEICRKAHDLDVNVDASIEAWKRRLLAYEAAMTALTAFDRDYKVCYGHELGPLEAKHCQMTDDKVRDCADARAVFAKTLQEAVDFFLQTGFEQGKQRIADEMRRKDYPAAMTWAEHTSARIELFAKLNQELPAIAHRAQEIVAARAEMKQHRAKAAVEYDKVIAKNRCPAGKNNDKKVVQALRPAVDGFFHSTDDTAVSVRVFRLNGKKITTHDAKLRETREEIPGIVCTEKKRADETFCQSFNVTVRRAKPDDGTWADWQVFVGSSERLLCKNVK